MHMYVSSICTKLTRVTGALYSASFLRRNLYSWPQEVKEGAYKGFMHPVLEYWSLL